MIIVRQYGHSKGLTSIQPLNYQHFVGRLGNSIEQLIDVLENHQLGGWWNVLQRYQFKGMDYIAGQNTRMKFHNSLVQAVGLADLIDVSNEILAWGNMRPINELMQNHLKESLAILNDENNRNLNQLCVERIASISKIYEMWQPTAWVIYDSYCAKGLQWLVSQLWSQTHNEVNADILRFPWPPGRVGAPINGFPRLGSENQARLGFIYASWLCRAIAEQLNENEYQEFLWQAYHIEMVAFQIGHEV